MTASTDPAPPTTGRALALVRTVWRGAVADTVSAGRLRAVDWPYGLGSVVAACAVLYGVAAALALGSSLLRRNGPLAVPDTLVSSTPVSVVWVLIFLMTACLSVLHVAGLHGPWWMKILSTLTVLGQLVLWTGAAAFLAGARLGTAVSALVIVGVLVLTLLRARRELAWWEVPVLLLATGTVVGLALRVMSRNTVAYGLQFTPLFLDEIVAVLGFFVLPAAFAAGVAVAEIAVAVTVVATRQAQRLTRRRWPFVILGVVVAARLGQVGRQLAGLDPAASGWLALGPALVLVAAFAGWGWLLGRLGRRPGGPTTVSELPAEVARVGLPIGVALTGLQIPVLLFVTALQIAITLAPGAGAASLALDPSPLVDRAVDVVRLLLALVLLGVSVRLARRGRIGPASVLGCAGLVVLALTMRLLTGYRWALWIDPDSLNLVATVVVLVAVVVHLVRRTLSRERAVALAGAMVLCALFSSRDFVSDPVGALIGYSGVGLVLFGLTWDFLTGSSWANGDSRRFPRPVRVLLVVIYSLLTATLLAYGALVRKPESGVALNAIGELGDLVLGTALLAAALTAVLATVRDQRPVQ